MGSGASNRRYKMENADNLSVGPSARSIAARGMDGAIVEERERETNGIIQGVILFVAAAHNSRCTKFS